MPRNYANYQLLQTTTRNQMQKEIREREILRLDLQNIQKHYVQVRVLLAEYVNYAHRHACVRNEETRRQIPENTHCLRLVFTLILISTHPKTRTHSANHRYPPSHPNQHPPNYSDTSSLNSIIALNSYKIHFPSHHTSTKLQNIFLHHLQIPSSKSYQTCEVKEKNHHNVLSVTIRHVLSLQIVRKLIAS